MSLNIALVGCGGMAHGHAQNLQKHPDVKVVALCDIRPEQTKLYKEKYFPEAVEFADFDTMLAKPPAKLDGVVLVTPHTLHYPHAKAALEHGINVLVEKPMVTSSEHAYDLWKTQKKTGKLVAISFQASYGAEFQYIKHLRDSGKLGKVQLIQGWLAQGWLKGTANSWRQQPEMSGGGQMYDSGAHVLNGMMWIMNDPVVEVSCMYDKCGSPVDINGVAIMRFQNGTLGSVAIGGASPGWHARLALQTDKLQLVVGPHGGDFAIAGDPSLKYPQVPYDARPGAFTPLDNFVRTIQGKEQPQVPVRYGVLLSALMDALYESADNQKVVKVKPVPADI